MSISTVEMFFSLLGSIIGEAEKLGGSLCNTVADRKAGHERLFTIIIDILPLVDFTTGLIRYLSHVPFSSDKLCLIRVESPYGRNPKEIPGKFSDAR